MTALPLIVGIALTGTVNSAACDPVLSTSRLADTNVRDDIKQYGPDAVAETYFLPLPRTCPRTPAGHLRWDLCR
jgi:hypothetical protein